MPNKSITLFPNPKINLGLFIKGKRSDGYHLLETVLYPIENVVDELNIELAHHGECRLTIEGIQLSGAITENLCIKAYNILKKEIPNLPGVNIHLIKRIPAGSGLGGGSSDAAFTLKGLNDLLELGFSIEQLAVFGATLGADVPFFLYNRPLLASGIGTEFEMIDIELSYSLKLNTSQIHSSTVAAYKQLDYRMFDPKRSLREVIELPIADWKGRLVNDLEVPVFQIHPEISNIKSQFYESGAVYAAMSGSGSAVFGLFEKL